jgi:hypothetical protein
MIVSDESEVVDKLYELADQFNEAFRKRQFYYALATRQTALTVMLTLMEKDNDCDKELLKQLFGDGNGEEEDVRGIFNRDKTEKARLECIKLNQKPPYVDALELLEITGIIS